MNASFTIALPDGAHFTTTAEEDLLAAAQRAHWMVRYGCRNGNCEACAATLLQGSVLHRDGRLLEAAAQQIFLCQCSARSDVQIDLPRDPRPGSMDQSLRSYAVLREQIVSDTESILYFSLPAGRKPALRAQQIALIETGAGLLQAQIDSEKSHGRELVVTLVFASPLRTDAYYYLRYPLHTSNI